MSELIGFPPFAEVKDGKSEGLLPRGRARIGDVDENTNT